MMQSYVDITHADLKLINSLVEKLYHTIAENPESIPLFKVPPASIQAVQEFFKEALVNDMNTPYKFIAFYDTDSTVDITKDEPVGVCLFVVSNLWYNPKLSALEEVITCSFKKGAGLVRRIINFMEDYARVNNINIICASCANAPVAKMVDNTYNKYNFYSYKTYYKEIKNN